jgi:hypothetical protein
MWSSSLLYRDPARRDSPPARSSNNWGKRSAQGLSRRAHTKCGEKRGFSRERLATSPRQSPVHHWSRFRVLVSRGSRIYYVMRAVRSLNISMASVCRTYCTVQHPCQCALSGVQVSLATPAMILLPSSFGDIVAAAQIAHSIYNALKDSTGSSSDYKSLIEELRSFETALHFVDRVLKATPVSDSVRQDIEAESTRCREMLQKFWDCIQRYEVIIHGGRRSLSAIWRKITWAIIKPEEVASFRRKLSQHKLNIEVFLITLGM